MPHRLGPKNIPMPQVPAKLGSGRNNNSTSSQDVSFDDSLGDLEKHFPPTIRIAYLRSFFLHFSG